jgi:hypothetical protein
MQFIARTIMHFNNIVYGSSFAGEIVRFLSNGYYSIFSPKLHNAGRSVALVLIHPESTEPILTQKTEPSIQAANHRP